MDKRRAGAKISAEKRKRSKRQFFSYEVSEKAYKRSLKQTTRNNNTRGKKSSSGSSTSTTPTSSQSSSSAVTDARPMSYDETRRLTVSVGKLPADKLSRIIHIVKEQEPEFDSPGFNDMVVDFESLKPATQREIEKYISSCLSKMTPRKLPGMTKQEHLAEKKEALEKRLQDVTKQLGGLKKIKKSKSAAATGQSSRKDVSSSNSSSDSSLSSSDTDSSSSDSSDDEHYRKGKRGMY